MPADHHIDNENKLIVTTWEGEATDIDFIKALEEYQKNIQIKPEYLDYNEIVNFSKVTSIKLTTEGLRNIAKIASITDQNRSSTKFAIVVTSGLAYGLARMYEVYRNFQSAGKKIRVFENESDALEWIRSDTE